MRENMLQNSFEQQGYVLLENFISNRDAKKLKQQAAKIVDAFSPINNTIFSSKDQRSTIDRYFLDSGDKISCFFEQGAFDTTGQAIVDKALAINKIGHALHEHDPVFKAFSFQKKITALLDSLDFANANALQSMYIFKQPKIGGEVLPHQDATYLQTEPQQVIGLWFALEDATINNGCLWALPGGHHSPLKQSFIRQGDNTHMEIFDHSDWDLTQFIPLEVKAGAVIVLHDKLPHLSHENRSSKSRQAYALHVSHGDSDYLGSNWLQRREPFPRF